MPTLIKAHYRRGFSYLKVGMLDMAKHDLLLANDLAEQKNASVLQALKMLKDKKEENKLKEREMSKKMFAFDSKTKKVELKEQDVSEPLVQET
mmetsp:Transcript_18008/g.30661  ORF Transcript_18008/g.30661 Transcript_18008/m.30661 type:complete len:93 (-) Transcript_18008:268-546(-)